MLSNKSSDRMYRLISSYTILSFGSSSWYTIVRPLKSPSDFTMSYETTNGESTQGKVFVEYTTVNSILRTG